jgi:hypothetical protein
MATGAAPSPVGQLIRHWRQRRRLSQLGLAVDAEISTRHLSFIDLEATPAPFLAVELRKGDLAIKFFSTLTTLGVPYDITLQELRVERFFPADAASETALRDLTGPEPAS